MEALFPGSRQRDFGEQDQDLPPGIKAALHRIEIDFGLSRPGHPVEKEGREPLAKTRRDLGCRGLLVLGQAGTGAGAGRRRGDSSLTRTASSEPAASMPVTTPALTPASRWSSADAIAPATPRISATRCRAA